MPWNTTRKCHGDQLSLKMCNRITPLILLIIRHRFFNETLWQENPPHPVPPPLPPNPPAGTPPAPSDGKALAAGRLDVVSRHIATIWPRYLTLPRSLGNNMRRTSRGHQRLHICPEMRNWRTNFAVARNKSVNLCNNLPNSLGAIRSMDHFSLVYDLCRAAVGGDPKEARNVMKRLGSALAKNGEADDAALITRLLKATAGGGERRALAFKESRTSAAVALDVPGEQLHAATHIPVDRESGASLAEIVPVERLQSERPVLGAALEGAVNDLLLEWQNAGSLASLGLTPSRTCLIYGPPGTGKTRLAHWLALQLQVPIILVRLDGLMSSYLGTTSRNIGNLFKFANTYRAVLLLDEFDAIAKLRDDPNEIGEIKRIVNTLLQELDARRSIGFTIAITNHPNLLDPAVWRRFEVQLETPIPDWKQRIAIIEAFLPPLEVSDGKLQLLSWALDGCSGAEIEDIIIGLKKSHALEPNELTFAERLTRISFSHGGRIKHEIRRLLASDVTSLALALLEQPLFSQARVAEALDLNRSTVSRWAKSKQEKSELTDGDGTTDSVCDQREDVEKAAGG